jgi:hypothetical protein
MRWLPKHRHDAVAVIVDDDLRADVKKHALRRAEQHRDNPSQRILTKNMDEAGFYGEFTFGRLIGYPVDISKRTNGDNGIDFNLNIEGYAAKKTCDVKTRKEREDDMLMLVEKDKVKADIYVCGILASDESNVEFVGWLLGKEVLKYPLGDLGTGVINHQVPIGELRPMRSLRRVIMKWEHEDDEEDAA